MPYTRSRGSALDAHSTRIVQACQRKCADPWVATEAITTPPEIVVVELPSEIDCTLAELDTSACMALLPHGPGNAVRFFAGLGV